MIRATTDFAGGNAAPLVDKLIGTAFEVVKAVYDNIEAIRYVAYNMNAIVVAAKTTGYAVPDYITFEDYINKGAPVSLNAFNDAFLVWMSTLPESDPHVLGQPWRNGEMISFSQG